jgi:LysR family tcuABC transcriptional regulator
VLFKVDAARRWCVLPLLRENLFLIGLAATIQPGAATVRARRATLVSAPLRDASAQRPNFLVSLSDDELSPAALATRVVVRDVTRQLVDGGRWPGATLHES